MIFNANQVYFPGEEEDIPNVCERCCEYRMCEGVECYYYEYCERWKTP
jgi:hypothetical protein